MEHTKEEVSRKIEDDFTEQHKTSALKLFLFTHRAEMLFAKVRENRQILGQNREIQHRVSLFSTIISLIM